MAPLALVGHVAGSASLLQSQPRNSRRQPCAVVRCSATAVDRREALKLLTSIPLLFAASPALAADRDISDDRKATGALRSMDQARDTDENQSKRFSMTESDGMTPDMHKKRIKESLSRLEKNVASDIAKKHFPRVSNDLRGQMSTLRFDLDALNASIKDKNARKKARKVQDEAMKALEKVDYLARTNNKSGEIDSAYKTAFSQLGKVVAGLG